MIEIPKGLKRLSSYKNHNGDFYTFNRLKYYFDTVNEKIYRVEPDGCPAVRDYKGVKKICIVNDEHKKICLCSRKLLQKALDNETEIS